MSEIEQRLAYLNLEPTDFELLASLEPMLEKNADAFVSAFYRHLLSFGSTRELLRDPAVKQRLLTSQREYLLSLAGPEIDAAFVEGRRRIGRVHDRIGLEPRWFLGAFALYFSLLTPLVQEFCRGDAERAARTLSAVQKLLSLDAQLALESYVQAQREQLEYLAHELASEGRELEREFAHQSAELRRSAVRERKAEELASIATLVAGLAHEIGTPMGVIQGHAKMLEGAVSGDDATWRLRTIQDQIARISKIIQTLLNMARPTPMRRLPVQLEPLIDTTLSFVSEKLARRRVEVERSCAPVPSVSGDAERLQQLLLNLVLNAADAMPDGGRLRVSLRESEDGEVEVRVGDSGVGIPDRDLAHVFEPFFTSKEAGEGYGLGLMVARGIALDHGGSIEVESVEGEGTEFRLAFPPARPEDLSGSGGPEA